MELIQYLGLWVLIAYAFNMWGWLSVIGSGARWTSRAVWTLLLFALPGIGFLGWYLLGPRQA
jgi:hypothetical protein